MTVALNVTFLPCPAGFDDAVNVIVVAAWFTCCTRSLRGSEAASVALPENEAEMSCAPAPRVFVVNEADPFATVFVPSNAPLSKKLTVPPVTMPEAGLERVIAAFKVIVCENVDGFALEPSAIVVGAGSTTCVNGGDETAVMVPFFVNVAVIECGPGARFAVVNEPTPAATTLLPINVVPS